VREESRALAGGFVPSRTISCARHFLLKPPNDPSFSGFTTGKGP
jgi:hypothetical protein